MGWRHLIRSVQGLSHRVGSSCQHLVWRPGVVELIQIPDNAHGAALGFEPCRWVHGIASRVRWPMQTTSEWSQQPHQGERTYDNYRNNACFFRKIRAMFPPNWEMSETSRPSGEKLRTPETSALRATHQCAAGRAQRFCRGRRSISVAALRSGHGQRLNRRYTAAGGGSNAVP